MRAARFTLAFTLAASTAFAQSALDLRTVTTQHQIRLDGKPLAYTATAAFMPMRDSVSGEVRAHIFHVVYTVARPASSAPRPLMFLWNGGPGSNSALVHVLAFGPKRLNTADRYPEFDVSTQLTWSDNQATWLDAADLVFVDPVGTGYSRPTRPEYGADFYNNAGDVRSVAEFIRNYVATTGSADRPIFLAGESFGVTRAAGVALALEQRGTRVAGVVLISLNLPLGEPVLTPGAEAAIGLPLYVASAFYHKKLAPDLQRNLDSTLRRARDWADRTYAPALNRRDALTPTERGAVLRDLSGFVGVPVALLDTVRLTVNLQRFRTGLLASDGLIFGNYDSRMTRPADPPATQYDPTKDPSLDKLLNQSGTLRYLRDELGVRQDVRYQGPFGGGYPAAKTFRGDWMSVRWSFGAGGARGAVAPGETPPLRRALDLNPAMRVLVMRGLYDTDGCEAVEQARLLPQPLAARVTGKCYLGGHSPYTDKEPRLAMRRDLEQFIDATLRGTAQAPRDSTIVTTRHRIMLGGRPLEYTARAGVLPIIDNNDATVRARVFFVAYTVARAPGAPPRPITFAWNGGPGANSLLLHLEAMGPRRLSDDGKTAVLGDNDLTWLDQTDLVFIDPVGTGYSRATRPEFEQEFYGVLGDVAATREFIRVYRTRFDAWEQPVYVAGESYGTWRAAGVADAMERFEEPVAGVILISGGIPVGEIISDPWRAATFLSARTLTAHHHKALPPELQPLSRDSAVAVVERWARLVYAPALARRDSLTPAERQEIVQRLSMYTGLALAQVDTQTLLVDRQYFIDNLLIARGAGGRLGRFDTRVVSGAPGSSTSGDSALTAQRRAVTLKYLREELGYATELPYYGLQGAAPNGPAQRWQYDQGPPGQRVVARNSDGPPGGRPSWIRSAMALNPRMRVFVATGNFDSLNSCSNMRYMVGLLREDERPNFTLGCYDGGHMMYEDRPARAQLKRDITGFYRRR